MMRTHAEAVTLAEAKVTEVAGHAGGRTRRIAFEFRTPAPNGPHTGAPVVAARLFETDVVTWHPDGSITVNIVGPNDESGFPGTSKTKLWATPSTFDGIAAALNISRSTVGTVKKIPYVLGNDLSSGSYTFPEPANAQPYA